MKIFIQTILAGIVFQSSCILAAGLKAGASTSDITPHLGFNIVGNFIAKPAKTIHDPMLARAIVLDDGTKKVALVVCDVLGVHALLTNEAKKIISEEVGIPPENVLISATHTHSGASPLAGSPPYFEKGIESLRTFMARRIADAVINANYLLRDAEVAYGEFQAPEYVFNRRWVMKDGTAPPNPFGKIDKVKMNPPAASKNLVEPAGPTDPTFSFMAFREPNGDLIALYATYALHYIGRVSPTEYTADYFGVYCRELEKNVKTQSKYGNKPFVAALTNGASGDINSNDYSKISPVEENFVKMHRVGKDLAKRTEAVLPTLEWQNDATLGAQTLYLDFKYRPLSKELSEWAKDASKQEPLLPDGRANLTSSYGRRLVALEKRPASVKLPLQFFRIGDVGIGTIPGELFVEAGLEFKQKSGYKHSYIIGLANDSVGYIPTPRHFELGGYETWPGTSHLETEASTKMIDALVKAGNSLKKTQP